MTDEELFLQAIELADSERDQFLLDSCDGSRQRERVEQLVSAHHRGDSLLDTDAHTPALEAHVPKTIGDFEILRELGRGGMGVVYEARQKSLNRKVALKVLSSGLGLSSKAILRFRREAEAAGKLHHTNIVPIYTTGEDRGVHFYAMELIDGPSLDQVLEDLRNGTEQNALALAASKSSASERDPSGSGSGSSTSNGTAYFDEVATMIADVADALDHAHEQGVIHRDIKPSNLLLSPDGRLSINDFGLARMLEQPGMTMSGEFVGSPLYMSPEQISAGRTTLDHRTDIYSLGAALYELLTLVPPFPGQTRDEVLTQILHKEPRPPRNLNRRIPADLETICLKAIEHDPDRRYQTAGMLADDLRSFVNRHAISARRIGPAGKVLRWSKRNKPLAAISSLSLIAILVLSFVAYTATTKGREERVNGLADRFILDCLSGDLVSAKDSLEEIREIPATDDLVKFLNVVHVWHGGPKNAQRAIELLEGPTTAFPGFEVAAYSMLVDAYSVSGDNGAYYARLGRLRRSEPTNWIEHAYKGMALQPADPTAAVENLEAALAERRSLGVTGALARALAWQSFYEVDPERSLQLAILATRHAGSAVDQASESRFLHSANVCAHLSASRAYSDQLSQAERHLAEARKSAETTMDITSQLTFEVAEYYKAANDEEGLIKLFEEQFKRDIESLEPYVEIWIAMAYYHVGKNDEALRIALASDLVNEPVLKMLIALCTAERFTSDADAAKALSAYMKDYDQREEGRDTQAFFDWYAVELLGGWTESYVVADDLKGLQDWHPWQDLVNYMSAPENERNHDELFATSAHNHNLLAWAQFAVALNLLKRGQESPAMVLLEDCAKDKLYGHECTQLSRTFLKKMNDGSGWPQWLRNRAEAK